MLEREEFQSISVRNEKEMIKKTRGWVMEFELNNMERENNKNKILWWEIKVKERWKERAKRIGRSGERVV